MTNRLSEEQIKVLAPKLAEMVLSEKRMSYEEMAKELGLARANLNCLRKSKTYLDLFERLQKTRETATLKAVKYTTLQVRQKLSDFTNEAIDTIYAVMKNPFSKDSDRINAACELLDRDGRFAKVSRLMQVRPNEDGAPMLPEDAAAEIMEALKGKVTVQ